jgi:predicted Zn-dependent protease
MDSSEREALAQRALSLAGSGEVEVSVRDEDRALTRFTHNAIHQNVADRRTTVSFRVVRDGRTGAAVTNTHDDASLKATARQAAELAELAPRDPVFPGLPSPLPLSAAPANAFVADTATASPQARAAIAADIFRTAEAAALWAAGFVATQRGGLTVANSRGVLGSFDGTECGINVKQVGPSSSGFAEHFGTDVAGLRGAVVGSVAADKAVRSRDPQPVDPGPWTTIFEPAAFGELLSYLLDHFSARSFDEGSSFLSDGLGRHYAGDNVTLLDDYTDPAAPGMPFDFEGSPRQRVALLENGVGGAIVTDSYWAAKLQRANTGHAGPHAGTEGPKPVNATLQPGTKPLEQLIAETKRGLLVSRLWYIRPVDKRRTIVTGMTRDGTFLIEDGKVTRGVRNMRFNQSILDSLRAAEFSSAPERTVSFNYSIVTPAAKVAGFHFTSTTDF